MKYILITFFTILLAGCANPATPQLFNGHYYMTGDENCVRFRALSPTSIMCLDEASNVTGYRNAMTNQDMQMYQIRLANQQLQMQQLNQSLQQLNQQIQTNNQQNYQYQTPQVQSWSPTSNSRNTLYHNSGNTWINSNGGSCQVIGSNVICSDGSHCVISGQNIICD